LGGLAGRRSRTAIAEQVLEVPDANLDAELRARLEGVRPVGIAVRPRRFRRFRLGYPRQGRTGRGRARGTSSIAHRAGAS
jgi:hypothetical protein